MASLFVKNSIAAGAVLSSLQLGALAWTFQSFQSSNYTPPQLTIEKSGANLSDGYLFFTPVQVLIDEAPLMMSDSGDLIWNGPGVDSTNFLVQSIDDEDVLTFWSGSGSNIGRGYGQVNILDQSYTTKYTICPDHQVMTTSGWSTGCTMDLHESLITDSGTILCTSVNVTKADLSSVGGVKNGWVYDTMFLEIDIKTQEILFMWSPLQAGIPISSTKASLGILNGFGLTQSDPFDWFHANSISKLQDGSYIISGRHTWTVYNVGTNGSVVWELEGSTGGDFGSLPTGGTFSWQHHTRTDNETGTSLVLHMFNDDNDSPLQTTPSNGLKFLIDTSAKTVELLIAYQDPNDLIVSSSQGAYQSLPNGNVLLGYGDTPTIKEFGADGDVRMTVTFGGGLAQSFRAYRFPWTGAPTSYPPSVRASRLLQKGWVSWNGDTRTTSWKVYTGSSTSNLTETSEVSRTGFETEFSFPSGATTVQVSAYSGTTLLMSSEVTTADLF